MPFRTPAEMPPKELLFKKPWWQIWTPRESFTFDDGDRLVWYWIKRWETADYKPSYLWYTTEGNWVFLGRARKSEEDSQTYIWCLYDEDFESLRARVVEIKTYRNMLYRRLMILKLLADKEDDPPPTVTRI